MALKLHNTLTRRLEEFEPLEPGKVRMYNCGPTVYNFATIGNFRAFIFADILRRYLEYTGLDVTQVMNITDVGHMTSDADEGEDKLEKAAREEKKDPWQIAELYMNAFFDDIDTLGIHRAHHYPRATEHVQEMIDIVKTLLDKGHAYEVNGCVYYDVSTFPKYGELSGNPLEQLEAGARVDVNPDKKHPRDFALWVTDPKHVMKWDSPWGTGYPGWHIECSAMSMKYLGDQLDIHTGGEDNIFPHHECEIAQSEGATGKRFVNVWLHTRFLLVDGQKMSKSLGNFYTLRDLLEKGCDPMALRYLLMSTSYRQPINFTLEGAEGAKHAVQRLRDFRRNLKDRAQGEDNPDAAARNGAAARIDEAVTAFGEAMDDDLNTSAALAAIFSMTRDLNKMQMGPGDAVRAREALNRFDAVLGVLGEEREELLDEDVERLIAERKTARKEKNFARADEIRDELKEQGILLEDTPQGLRWKRG